jgi:hypothetical protein
MATYFVDWKEGDDSNDGSVPAQALKRNSKALELADEGDTVLVKALGSTYTENVVENGELRKTEAVDNG